MINLIPAAAKKKVITEYWVRVLTVWLGVWAVALLAGASLLYPTYELISAQIVTYEDNATMATERVASYLSAKEGLERANDQARVVLTELERPLFSNYITLLEGLQGSGVVLSRVQLSRSADGVGPIMLVGEAVDRKALTSFRDRLLAEAEIQTVDLPISNLAEDKDITFNLTVTLQKEEK